MVGGGGGGGGGGPTYIFWQVGSPEFLKLTTILPNAR